jgi:hypothetical protein
MNLTRKDIIKMAVAPFIVFMVSYYLDQFTPVYRIFEWPNRLMHFLGGLSISVPIYFVLKWMKANKFISTSSKWIDFILIVMSAMCVASLWEFHEYFHDKYFPGPFLAQPSVDDTMKDMIMGMLGSIVFVFGWYISSLFKKPLASEVIVKVKSNSKKS